MEGTGGELECNGGKEVNWSGVEKRGVNWSAMEERR